MTKKERIEGELLTQTSQVKLTKFPFQVYSKQLEPKEGLELLYRDGEENGKVMINPSGFPWITLNLDPMGSIMRNNQHHTILNSGYDLVVSILEYLFEKYGEETKELVSFLQPVSWQGIPCYAISFDNPHFKYITYQMKEGETFLSHCDSLKISEHMVLELNRSIDDYDEDLEEGEEIIIPNDYSPKMIIYVDRERLIPLMMKVFDDKGVYEVYQYYDVQVDPEFAEDEFTPEYRDYDF